MEVLEDLEELQLTDLEEQPVQNTASSTKTDKQVRAELTLLQQLPFLSRLI